MSNPIKLFSILIITGVFLGAGLFSLAQEAPPSEVTEAVNLDENVQPEDLGISEPTLLPDSPFYFLKNWGRAVSSFFTFNPVAKSELKEKFASEKLMELKKMVEQNKNAEALKKASENYQKEVEEMKKTTEAIKQKARENPEVDKFLNKFINQQTLHQKLLQKLEIQVPPQALEKIKEARETHLDGFQNVMLKLEDRTDKITEKLNKTLEEQKGSQFKNFKNLEILKNLEKKAPEQAKEAIQKAQENALKRLQGNLEKMSPENQEKFKEYIEKISGEKEKQMEIMEDLKTKIKEAPETPRAIELKEKLEEGKAKILERIKEKVERLNCPLWEQPPFGFCKEGRVIIEKSPVTGCPLYPRCIIPGEVKLPEAPERVCIQVITPAKSPEGICKEFPTPCDVPSDWRKVDKCPE